MRSSQLTNRYEHGPLFSIALACAAACALLTVGCNGSADLYPVSGTVTFNGNPIPDGYISFVHQDGRTTPRATPIVEGEYSKELPAGPHRVIVEASKFVGGEDKVMGLRPRDDYIPDRYNVETELSLDVQPDGENKFDFQLTD